jgi:pimeloyl-ACP methyl ester carboxylesterase
VDRLTVNGVDLAYDIGGAGPPLVLVHGYTGSSLDWTDVLGALRTQATVLVYDHRGHGESTNTGDASTYTLDQLTSDLAGLVDALALTRFDLLGHSMGGMVAMAYATAHQDRLRSLVLMDTAAAPFVERSQMMTEGLELARTQGLDAVLATFAPFVPDTPQGRRALERMRTSYGQMDREAFVALGEAMAARESVLESLSTITIPTTVMVGELDGPFREPSEAMAAAIPGAELVVIPGCGHSPQEEDPQAWLAAMRAHLARAEAPAGPVS